MKTCFGKGVCIVFCSFFVSLVEISCSLLVQGLEASFVVCSWCSHDKPLRVTSKNHSKITPCKQTLISGPLKKIQPC